MRRALLLLTLGLAIPLVAADKGCVGGTTTFDVSPDLKTLYVSLNADAGLEVDASSLLYSFDVDSARLRALTGRAGEMGCPAISPDGKTLAFVRKVKDNQSLHTMSLDTLVEKEVLPAEDAAACPRFVPGFADRLIVLTGKKKWLVRGAKDWEPLAGEDEAIPAIPPALALRRAAFAVARPVPAGDEQEKRSGQSVVVFDFTGEGHAEAARITIGGANDDDEEPGFQPILSPDGRRLVIAARKEGSSYVREVDLDRKALGAKLFRIGASDDVSFMPDGRGFVILRACADSPLLTEVAIRRDGDAEEKRALLIPGAWDGPDRTAVRWRSASRMRIYRMDDSGVSVYEVNADGSAAEARWLPEAKLRVERRLADAAAALAAGRVPAPRSRPAPEAKEPDAKPPEGGEPAKPAKPSPLQRATAEMEQADQAAADEAVKALYALADPRDPAAARLLEEQWLKAAAWETVPGFPNPPAMILALKTRQAALLRALLDKCSRDPDFAAGDDRRLLEKSLHDLDEELLDLRKSLP